MLNRREILRGALAAVVAAVCPQIVTEASGPKVLPPRPEGYWDALNEFARDNEFVHQLQAQYVSQMANAMAEKIDREIMAQYSILKVS